MTGGLTGLGVEALARLTRAGKVSPREALEAALSRIDTLDPGLGCFIDLDREVARARAAELESLAPGERGPLHGVPIGIKDNILLAGAPARAASAALRGFRAPYTATAVERLLAAGAVPLGRLNMDEFAMGSSTETSAHGLTRNPWDRKRVPGGSSGGSAAAVAARLVPAALGSDTGGSVRQPAALCGVTGLKPTYGRVSRWGLISFGSSLDQIGPLTRSARDAALLLGVMGGRDERDATSRPEPLPAGLDDLRPAVAGVRLGLPREYFGPGIEAEVRESVLAAVETLREAGAEVREVDLPLTRHAIPAYYLVANAEACSNLARYDGVHYGARASEPENLQDLYERSREEGFGTEVKRRILLGTFCLSSGYYDAWYKKALQVRTLMRREFEAVFAEVDLLLGPTSPHRAFRFGEKMGDPIQMYKCDELIAGASLAGLPALSVPCGVAEGLPVGLQITGPPLAELRVLALGAAYQERTDWHEREPRA